MRDQILIEIRRLAETMGRSPSRLAFERATGIRNSQWLGMYWTKWNDALAEAGLPLNKTRIRLDDDELLEKLALATRHYGRLPTEPELTLYARKNPGFPSHGTLQIRLGNKDTVAAKLREWVSRRSAFADVLALLPLHTSFARARRAKSPAEGFVHLLRSGAHYMICRSDELELPTEAVVAGPSEEVTLEHTIRTDDAAGIEAYWRRRFAVRRIDGEWFKLSPTEVAAFKKRGFQ